MAIIESTYGFKYNTNDWELWSNIREVKGCVCCNTLTHLTFKHKVSQVLQPICFMCYTEADQEVPDND